MRIRINIITQNRSRSLLRLLRSLKTAHYVGDIIDISFNMDSRVDTDTLRVIDDFEWPHGTKHVRRRIIQGGLIRAVSESWYPASDDDFGLLLEDDIEVSPFYYMWLKYALLTYHYDPTVNLPELNSIALYSPRVIEIVKERPHWNATDFFSDVHPNTPYLHQLPCSWGALFFPKRWREFYKYMGMRFTEDAKANPVQIPKSRTNGWQVSLSIRLFLKSLSSVDISVVSICWGKSKNITSRWLCLGMVVWWVAYLWISRFCRHRGRNFWLIWCTWGDMLHCTLTSPIKPASVPTTWSPALILQPQTTSSGTILLTSKFLSSK